MYVSWVCLVSFTVNVNVQNLPEPMPSHATRTDSHSMDQYGSVWVLGEKKKAVSVLVLVRGKPEEKFGSFRNGVHDSIIHQMKSMDGVGIYVRWDRE